MKRWILTLSLVVGIATPNFPLETVTHAALQGIWTYFYITTDSFASDKIVATEQRLLFRDGHNVTLEIFAKEAEYVQKTSYNLKYTLSYRDNVVYLSLFSTESSKRLGSYIRIPLDGSLEMAGDPNFLTQKQLYKKMTPPVLGQVPTRTPDPFPVTSTNATPVIVPATSTNKTPATKTNQQIKNTP